MAPTAAVIGGGLAGTEAAGVLSRGGIDVTLFEQKPGKTSPAHKSPMLGELVCSNSLKSDRIDRPQGWLKAEMRAMGSLVMQAAEGTAVPGGEALVVDRERFAAALTGLVSSLSGVEIIRYEVTDIRELAGAFDAVVLASGPLTSEGLAASLVSVMGDEGLHFYDAISPIVAASSIDTAEAFRASRYDRGGDDYINCPMSREVYGLVRNAILEAEKVEPRPFEEARYFEACLPIETIASRGELALAYGPLSPAGLKDPKTGKRPYCNLQLRMENAEGTAYSLVAFQTRMKYGEQERVLKMVPALRNAEFLRYGSIHRNTFLDAPRHLNNDLSFKAIPTLFAAGVLTGVEGYCESAVSGILSGLFALARVRGGELPQPPPTTCTGALHMHVKGALAGPGKSRRYQPMNMNRGILPEFRERVPKQQSFQMLYERAMRDLGAWLEEVNKLGLGI
jgi:methylenetetrahydrofolate--tRNA-(uracil-5-)-methyltransferase